MGCWNVGDSVSRTPIADGDTCHVIVFKDHGEELFRRLAACELSDVPYILSGHFEAILHGRYNDYGALYEHPDIIENGKTLFFVSDEAWTKGKELLAKSNNKGWIDRCVGAGELGDILDSLTDSIAVANRLIKGDEDPKLKADIEKHLADRENKPLRKHRDDLKVVVALVSFCYTNGLNLFDPSWAISSMGQSYAHVCPEWDEWMSLRKARIAARKKRAKDAE